MSYPRGRLATSGATLVATDQRPAALVPATEAKAGAPAKRVPAFSQPAPDLDGRRPPGSYSHAKVEPSGLRRPIPAARLTVHRRPADELMPAALARNPGERALPVGTQSMRAGRDLEMAVKPVDGRPDRHDDLRGGMN